MGEFGQYLRRLRESQGLSPERVCSLTKVPVRHLIALESEEFQSLPSDASARGFVKLLARQYKVNEQELLRQYDGAVAPQGPVAPPLPLSQTNATIFRLQPSGRGHAGLGVGVGVIVVILLALGWMRGNQSPVTPTAMTQKQVAANKSPAPRRPATAEPPRAAEARPDATASPTPSTVETITQPAAPASVVPSEPAPSAPAPAPALQLRLEIQATEQSWIQAKVDGAELREALLQPGERLLWTAAEAMEVTIGNAGGLTLVFNGEPVTSLGEPGQVVHLRMTAEGVEKVRRSRPTPRPESLPPSALAF